jgi:hypothetical protein
MKYVFQTHMYSESRSRIGKIKISYFILYIPLYYPSKNRVKNCPNYQQALIHTLEVLQVFLKGPNLSTLYSNIV